MYIDINIEEHYTNKCVRSGIHFWWPRLSPVSQAKSQRQHSSTVILSPSSKEELIKLATRTVWSEGRDCDGKSHFCNNFAINLMQCCNAMSTLPSSDCSNPLNKVWCCQRERSKYWSYFTRRKNIQYFVEHWSIRNKGRFLKIFMKVILDLNTNFWLSIIFIWSDTLYTCVLCCKNGHFLDLP